MLPIEFARKSSDGRLTLVIHAGCRKQRTYWANSSCERLCDAIETLKSVRAEVPQDIHFVGKGGSAHRGDSKSVSVV